jgi:hypothetical protein
LIFLVEGINTIVVALLLIVFFPSDPTTTRLFDPEQRRLAQARIEADNPNADHKEPINWPSIKQSFLNMNVMAYCFIYIASKRSA